MTDAINANDAAYARHMERGSATLLAAMQGRKTSPRDLHWHEKVNQGAWSQGSMEREYTRAAILMAEKEAALSRVVYRDPCPLCGVRGDLGCNHRRAA